MAGVVQVGLEITDDGAEKAPGEKARPERAIGTLADRRGARGRLRRLILLDTSGLLAAVDSAQRAHAESAASLAAARPPRLLSPFVLAELDYLLATRVGEAARTSLLGEVVRGVYRLEPFSAEDVQAARTVVERYADPGISLAEASITVIAARHGTQDVLTLDERHFRVLNANGQRFRLLPADA